MWPWNCYSSECKRFQTFLFLFCTGAPWESFPQPWHCKHYALPTEPHGTNKVLLSLRLVFGLVTTLTTVCVHVCDYRVGEEAVSLRLLRDWVSTEEIVSKNVSKTCLSQNDTNYCPILIDDLQRGFEWNAAIDVVTNTVVFCNVKMAVKTTGFRGSWVDEVPTVHSWKFWHLILDLFHILLRYCLILKWIQ
jgi:hypothetical protein